MAHSKLSISEKILEEIEQSPSEAKDTVAHLLEIMKSPPVSGENIMISKIGKFQGIKKAPRKRQNPATGQEMILEKRRVVRLKCFAVLKDLVNRDKAWH